MSGSSTSSLTITNAEGSWSSPEPSDDRKEDKDKVKETENGPPKMGDLTKLKELGNGSAILDERGIPKGKDKAKEVEKVVEEKASETKAPEVKTPEVKAPEVKASEVKAPEKKAPEEKSAEEKPGAKRNDEGYATNLFYAYARRTDSDRPSNSVYILTFTSASTVPTLVSAIKSAFPDANFSRDAPQLFTFKGSDLPEKAWSASKKPKLQELKSKWFFSPASTAQVLPLQDEKGWLISPPSPPSATAPSTSSSPPPTRPATASRTPSIKGKEKKTVGFADQLPSLNTPLDIAKLERNLDRVTKLMETNASQISSLSSYQETTYDTLASALSSSLEQIKALTQSQQRLVAGQQRLLDACDELRKAMRDREVWAGGSVAFSSNASNVSCGHEVHKPPRKVGRRVVGYVYGEEGANGQN